MPEEAQGGLPPRPAPASWQMCSGCPGHTSLVLLRRRTGWHIYAATRRRPAYPGAPPGVLPPLNSARDATSYNARSLLAARDALAGEEEAPWEAPSDEFWEEAEEKGPSLDFLIAATRQPQNKMIGGAFF